MTQVNKSLLPILVAATFIVAIAIPAFAQTTTKQDIRQAFESFDFERADRLIFLSLANGIVSEKEKSEFLAMHAYCALALGKKDMFEQRLRILILTDPKFNPSGHRLFGTPEFVEAVEAYRKSVHIMIFKSRPEKAEVRIGGKKQCTTPCRLAFPVTSSGTSPELIGQRYNLEFYLPNYRLVQRSFQAQPEAVETVVIAMELIQGTLSVTSIPPNQPLFINDKAVGETPYTASMAPGRYQIRIEGQGQKPWAREVEVRPNQKVVVNGELASLKGYLSVMSTPSEALVRIQGRASGKTPIQSIELDGGSYEVIVSLEGREVFKERVNIEPGKTQEVSASLIAIKKPAAETPPEKPATKTFAKEDTGRGLRIAGWSLVGVSVASFIGSAVFYNQSMNYQKQADDESLSKSEYDALIEDIQSSQMIAAGLSGIGLGAGIGGGYCLWKGYGKQAKTSLVDGAVGFVSWNGKNLYRLTIGVQW
jgi:PEGA domain